MRSACAWRRCAAGLYGLASLATAFAVTTAGAIGFVGLVVPHALRLALGNDQRMLLPASALAGGTLLLLADTAARSLLGAAAVAGGRGDGAHRRAGVLISAIARGASMSAVQPILETRGLHLSIGGKQICRDLNFSVQQGERWGVLGVNGVGKTSSSLCVVWSCQTAQGGSVYMQGKLLSQFSGPQLARTVRRDVQDSDDALPASAPGNLP